MQFHDQHKVTGLDVRISHVCVNMAKTFFVLNQMLMWKISTCTMWMRAWTWTCHLWMKASRKLLRKPWRNLLLSFKAHQVLKYSTTFVLYFLKIFQMTTAPRSLFLPFKQEHSSNAEWTLKQIWSILLLHYLDIAANMNTTVHVQ